MALLCGLTRHLNSFLRIFFLGMALMHCSLLVAGEYTPPGLYEVEYYQLPNGLHVLLKERHQARSVSYRVVVNVGQADYPCGLKETPHFIGHLFNPLLKIWSKDTAGRQKLFDFLPHLFRGSFVAERWQPSPLLSVIGEPDIPVLALLFLTVLVCECWFVDFHNMFP